LSNVTGSAAQTAVDDIKDTLRQNEPMVAKRSMRRSLTAKTVESGLLEPLRNRSLV
jgi:hypothetical protein